MHSCAKYKTQHYVKVNILNVIFNYIFFTYCFVFYRILLVASDGENYTHIALKSELKEFSLSLNEEVTIIF